MAKEYIEREAARKRIVNNKKWSHDPSTMEYAAELVLTVPAADVVEAKHGYWIPSPDGINPIRCSECNVPAPFAAGENEFGDFEICRYPSSYCHECGAKMDGERKTE